MKKVLITGFNGFIGSKLRETLNKKHNISGVDLSDFEDKNYSFHKADFTKKDEITKILSDLKPDVIVHCAGIAHQKAGSVSEDEYFRINSSATYDLAKIATNVNPDIHFIFLSTISVYGEDRYESKINEDNPYNPTSSYAKSKLEAEEKIKNLDLAKLDILRLSPVYDSNWTLNLDRRVFFPKKLFYLKFGNGKQKMSALARGNIVDFIDFLIANKANGTQILNVSDEDSYRFNEIITTFKKSTFQPNRLTLKIPLISVWILTRVLSFFFRRNREWVKACYDKVAYDLIFDNTRMKETGFKPKYNIKNIFLKG
ncbi:MAG: NAD-dependent epimerase/dehydratase family protein [Desulfobacterales bacterium]|nr:NAD-dependent epimerase/dehydratase family protein [Desulfobacterales bacterium]